jgi:hypothetical protein
MMNDEKMRVNLPDKDKLALITKISNSIALEKNLHKKKGKKSKMEILTETYDCFQSTQTADEIIEEVYNSRHFIDKNHRLQGKLSIRNPRKISRQFQ